MAFSCLRTYALFSVLLAFLLASVSVAACRSCSASYKLCGPNCVLVVCQRLGVETTLVDLKALCSYDDIAGTTLLGLMNAAKAKGLQAVAMKISVAELAAFDGQTIAHLWDNHFVVVEPGDVGNLKVTDPPAQPVSMKIADFQKAYSGFALLIAKDAVLFPKPKDEGPDLRLDGYSWDFGSINDGERPTHSIKCRNAGSAELVISKVEASCSCIVPLKLPAAIPAGEEGVIDLLFDSEGQAAGVAKTLYVSSNDPVTPVAQFQVGGYVRSKTLRFSPREVKFGKSRRSSESVRELHVLSTPEDSVNITSVASDSPFIEATLAPSKLKELPGYVITATLKPGAPVGEFKAKLTVVSDHPKQPKAEIPITAMIKGNIDLDRDSFFLGIAKKGKQAVANVTLSTVAREPLKLGKIDSPRSYLTVEAKPRIDGGYTLTATLAPDAPVGNIKGDITVHTSDPDQPEIKIPVYAYVEQ